MARESSTLQFCRDPGTSNASPSDWSRPRVWVEPSILERGQPHVLGDARYVGRAKPLAHAARMPRASTAFTPSTTHGGQPRSRGAPVATTMASSARCSRSIDRRSEASTIWSTIYANRSHQISSHLAAQLAWGKVGAERRLRSISRWSSAICCSRSARGYGVFALKGRERRCHALSRFRSFYLRCEAMAAPSPLAGNYPPAYYVACDLAEWEIEI